MLRQLKNLTITACFCAFLCVSVSPSLAGAQGKDTSLTDLAATAIKTAKEKASEMKAGIKTYVDPNSQEWKDAEKAIKKFHSPQYQKIVEKKKQQIREIIKTVTGDTSPVFINTDTDEKRGRKEKSVTTAGGKYYLFLSSSIGLETFRNYLQSINDGKTYITPIMRGLVGGIDNKTANKKFFAEVLKKEGWCRDSQKKACPRFKTDIFFQSPLFVQYHITQVPALVFDDGKRSFLIQGDADLNYLIERINRKRKEDEQGKQ